MKNTDKKQGWLFSVRRYFAFFLLTAFIISCCMILFLNLLADSSGIDFSKEYIEYAAKATFLNVILLSLLFTIIDGIRRKFMVERPVKKIVKAAEQLMKGDFSVRIPPFSSASDFNVIADYFNKMAQELSGVETLRTDFIANVSHELKTPLAVIQNYGTMLMQPELPSEKRMEYARAVTETSRRLAHLITNILKLNKLENQQIYPAAQKYNLGEQLCECFLTYESVWEEKELEIETDIAEGITVEADSELLALVWNNLFSNAVKFTPPGGKIFLSLKAEEDYAVIRVSDTGCGIPPEVGKHIFEKFYQGDTSHASQGNGLGLALVKRVMDIIGGDISVSSTVSKGSTFTVKIRRSQLETS